jgi:hypothetical protein
MKRKLVCELAIAVLVLFVGMSHGQQASLIPPAPTPNQPSGVSANSVIEPRTTTAAKREMGFLSQAGNSESTRRSLVNRRGRFHWLPRPRDSSSVSAPTLLVRSLQRARKLGSLETPKAPMSFPGTTRNLMPLYLHTSSTIRQLRMVSEIFRSC